MQQFENNMKQIGANIDYAVNKFQEVDDKCAQAIKSSGYNFRKNMNLLNASDGWEGVVQTSMRWGDKAWKECNKIENGVIAAIAFITNKR